MASRYEELSARAIRNDIHRRRTEYAEKRRQKRFAKEKALKRKREVAENEKVEIVKQGSENLATDIVKIDKSEDKKTKRTLKREQENANKLWRNFDRYGLEGEANAEFSAYYRVQLDSDITTETEWELFMKSLATDLPVTFRLNSQRYPVICRSLKHRLQTEFQFKGQFIKIDNKVLSGDILTSLEWYRDSNLWQINASRIGFSKCEVLKPLHELVTRESQLGHMARQGCASMLPAIALKVDSSHVVLDLCAAPGSKTEQVLGLMSGNGNGFLVSNDSDPKRIEHMKRRFDSIESSKLIITGLRGEDLCANIAQSRKDLPEHDRAAVFDRIICDVPCTGDGTVRKMAYLWRRWRARRALLIHPLQLQLALSAASLLKVGGRMVYSTCSLNPIENEAVIHSILKATKGALRLVPADIPKGFRVRQGYSTWDVNENVLLPEDDHMAENHMKKRRKNKLNRTDDNLATAKILKTMHPPQCESKTKKLNLNHCCRVLPHDNDTGGFFIAVLEKVKPWSATENSIGNKHVSANLALQVLQNNGYNARQGDEATNLLEMTRLSKFAQTEISAQYGLRKDTYENLWVNLKAIPEEENETKVYMVSSKLSDSLNSWARSLPKVKVGATVCRWTKSDPSNFMLVPFAADEFVPRMGKYKFSIDLENFKGLLVMIEDIVSQTTDESQPITFMVEWLFDLFSNDTGVDLNEKILDIPVGQCFALQMDTSWLCIQSSKESNKVNFKAPGLSNKVTKSHLTERRLSKAERKRMKKRRNISETKSTCRIDTNSAREPVDDTLGSMSLIMLRKSEEQILVLTPIEVMQSYDDVLN